MTAIEFEIPGLRCLNRTNGREHWAVKAKRTKTERLAVVWHWPKGQLSEGLGEAEVALVTLTRIGPRRMDDDNAAASMKAVRDAVAKRLGVDDGDVSRLRFVYRQERGPFAVRVRVECGGGNG